MFRPLRQIVFYSSLMATTLTSCATLKDHHCGTSDWGQIGATDASRLRPVEFELNHKKVCGEDRVDVVAYEAGYAREMEKMCTPDDAFIFGYLNKAKNSKCKTDENLDANYKNGVNCRMNVARLSQLQERRSTELEREKSDAEDRRHEGVGKTLVRNIFAGDTRVDSEVTLSEIQQIQEEQRTYERNYEGAFIRAHYLQSMARNYDY